MNPDFEIQKPFNNHLQSLVDYYFYIDIPLSKLDRTAEHVIPFPRITFGTFFDHPFEVTNHTTGQKHKAEMVISKISTDQISVKPLTERIKILGAHVRPYTLAHLTTENISKLPWIIPTEDLFKAHARQFRKRINGCTNTKAMFVEVERIFLKTLLNRDLSLITRAVNRIESKNGHVTIGELSEEFETSNRTLRNHFYRSVGCSPKEYIHLVKLKSAVYQMKHSPDSLTAISYDQNFADQAHFTRSFVNLTGSSPKDVRKNIADFRFLQF